MSNTEIIELAKEGMAIHKSSAPEFKVCEEVLRLHEVNQALLVAFKSLVNSYQRLKPMGYPLSDSEKQAQAAIAKAEGNEK